MVSGKPPRHSKSKAEPVTIDLDAKDVTEIGKESPPTPEVSVSTNQTETPKNAPADTAGTENVKSEAPKPIWDQPVRTPIEPQPNVGTTEGVKVEGPKPEATAKPASSAAPKPEQAKPEQAKTEPPKPQATKPSPETKSFGATTPPPKKDEPGRSNNSGLIAAGIVGGLVALLAAGSMQYAGYLPPFSGTSSSAEELNALKTQIANLREQVANTPAATTDTSALEQRIAALESGSAGSADTSALSEKIAALETALQSQTSAQGSATEDLTRRLGEAEAKINEPRDDIEVARAIASAALKAAIDRGGPFLTELDTLAKVTPDDPAIASLRSFATTGVPSRAELLRNFPDVANTMLSAINQPDPNQGIVERLTESAFSLVKVRPVGNIEGETPDAVIARMENKLRNGDLQGAALEWDSLPDAAKTVSADYKKSLDARINVENLVGDTLNRAIGSTGKQG
ncbi:COG4223 family protein [Agrobacterium tumefaciens]|uniref:COG4223 family protein n=1 Tax=Agrobacterium tumefaciens TaxID=358 RepID=UPI0021D149CA|nr:COG4223 family protein [Agrobacterium tumefaciens]UXS02521.1 hypothetical protein FY156_14125 [Agrobacterium tumefaciens]